MLWSALAWALLTIVAVAPAQDAPTAARPDGAPLHVVLFIGDGLGASMVTLGRLAGGDDLVLDELLVGTQSVAPVGAVIPDSAATRAMFRCWRRRAVSISFVDESAREWASAATRATVPTA